MTGRGDGELSGRDGDPEAHEITIRDINITRAIRLSADVPHGESTSEERVRGVGHLDLIPDPGGS